MSEWRPIGQSIAWGYGTPNYSAWKKETQVIDGVRVYRETTTKGGETKITYYADGTPVFDDLPRLLRHLVELNKTKLR